MKKAIWIVVVVALAVAVVELVRAQLLIRSVLCEQPETAEAWLRCE